MKKFLLSLCVGFLGIISFCSASTYTIQGNTKNGGLDPIMVVPQSFYSKSFSVHCVFSSENLNCQGGSAIQFGFKFAQIYNSSLLFSTLVNTNNSYSIICDNPSDIVIDYDFSTYTPGGGPYSDYYGVYFIQFSSLWYIQDLDIPYSCTFVGDNILSAGICPEVNTGEILSGYILESSIDTNYCVGNGLCPNECGSGTDMSGDLQYSNFYINDILHPGTENIFLNIQDNIFWDYSESESGLVVDVGSGYDQDYIDGVINVQSYRPTSEDFTQTFVGGLILFTPYVVILLFVILVRNLIKKIFKTK